MWLINVETLELEQAPSYDSDEVEGQSSVSLRPKYAILSHRWQSDEVSFHDMRSREIRQSRRGWQKLVNCCAQAKQDGLAYVWLDTCCINKDSDAELTEAINSMYRWYRDATICYAYLYDMVPGQSLQDLGDAELWTRGWCLQELIAPLELRFHDRDWHFIGDKVTLQVEISHITGIHSDLLVGRRRLDDFSIAQKMSWAAKRKTTRPEDRAYSLLGIFGVSMPMIYGEGALRAFQRLQEEIIKDNDDHTIFAWTRAREPKNYGLLAHSPMPFVDAANMRIVPVRRGRKPYSVTNRGVSITLAMTPWTMNTYIAVLNCISHDVSAGTTPTNQGYIGIFLARLQEDDAYARVSINGVDMIEDLPRYLKELESRSSFKFATTLINVRQKQLSPLQIVEQLTPMVYGFRLSETLLGWNQKSKNHLSKVYLQHFHTFVDAERLLIRNTGVPFQNLFATIDMQPGIKKIKMVKLFLDATFNPIIFLAESSAVNEKVKVLNKAGNFNYSGSDDKLWNDKDREGFKEFKLRTITDEHGWNDIVPMPDGSQLAKGSKFRRGLWQIRGDRVDGIDIRLEELGQRPGQTARLVVKLGQSTRGPVWDVDIVGLGS